MKDNHKEEKLLHVEALHKAAGRGWREAVPDPDFEIRGGGGGGGGAVIQTLR